MAEAAAIGAATEPGVDVRLVEAVTARPDDVLAADGYVFAAPEKLAALSGLMKDFFDRCYYPVLGRINGRPYGPHDLRRQRWYECGPAGEPHSDRLALAGRGGASNRLHVCPNA